MTEIDGNSFEVPNDKYKKFFNTFNEISTLDTANWKPSHIIGYFCKKYEDHYNTKYKFKFNSPAPSKCFEVFQIKKLGMVMTSNPVALKEYIDWAFKVKIVQAKRKITSISFLTNEPIVQEYKMNFLFAPKLDRSSNLPSNIKDILSSYDLFGETYGDLAFISQMEKTEEITNALTKIEAIFDISLLTKIN